MSQQSHHVPHHLEAKDSWEEYQKRQFANQSQNSMTMSNINSSQQPTPLNQWIKIFFRSSSHTTDKSSKTTTTTEQSLFQPPSSSRLLKKHHDDDKHKHHESEEETEEYEVEHERAKEKKEEEEQARIQDLKDKHRKKMDQVSRKSGIKHDTTHGMMIDAGSTGSRMHVYEFKKRILTTAAEISATVEGRRLSYPGSDSRWTDRVAPGIATLAKLSDAELLPAIRTYLQPFMDFVTTVLQDKKDDFGSFPIYFRATAGMRVLSDTDRARVLNVVRNLFYNKTYCPFQFSLEQARVLSGEEEAIYGWTAVNFVLGTLIKNSEGSGTVVNPRRTHGALEMGGASTQISFYQPNEDVMSNLFKLQIGQGKHWNVYAHSFLYYGINEAWERAGAFLATNGGMGTTQKSVYNPCLTGGTKVDFTSNIYFTKDGMETWFGGGTVGNVSYSCTLLNNNQLGDFQKCSALAEKLVKKNNGWCNFAHHGDCSIANVYQPKLPQDQSFGDFLAFSNYYDIIDFLNLPNRTTVASIQQAAQKVCSMSAKELTNLNDGRYSDDEQSKLCFNSLYVYHLLHKGYGFDLNYNITYTNVIEGQKIGWALGSMLYEINTLPWSYNPSDIYYYTDIDSRVVNGVYGYLGALFVLAIYLICRACYRRKHLHHHDLHHHSSEAEHLKRLQTEQYSTFSNGASDT